MIVGETNRCKGIVSSLLDFARQNQVEAQPADVNALITTLIEVEGRHKRPVAIEFVADLDTTLPIIQADPAQLREVLLNLMANGMEAMPDGGQLTICTCSGPPGMVTIEVRDAGADIPAEHLSKLFTPFFTPKPVGKGPGLGLAISYGISKMRRGQITVRSRWVGGRSS